MYYEQFLKAYAEKHGLEVSAEIVEVLNGYDPRQLYPANKQNFKPMSVTQHKIEVGKISNLIKRMNEQNAPVDELGKALRHLLVVIDAQKYFLDYKRSAQDHDIANLIAKYPSNLTTC